MTRHNEEKGDSGCIIILLIAIALILWGGFTDVKKAIDEKNQSVKVEEKKE